MLCTHPIDIFLSRVGRVRSVSSLFPEVVRARLFESDNETTKQGVKSFLTHNDDEEDQRLDLMRNKPAIADLFKDTTVLFAGKVFKEIK